MVVLFLAMRHPRCPDTERAAGSFLNRRFIVNGKEQRLQWDEVAHVPESRSNRKRWLPRHRFPECGSFAGASVGMTFCSVSKRAGEAGGGGVFGVVGVGGEGDRHAGSAAGTAVDVEEGGVSVENL